MPRLGTSPHIFCATRLFAALLVAVCIVAFGVSVCWAESKVAPNIEEVLSMSLEELLSINVVSKETESVIDSPAVVSTYYRKQLQNLGLHSLKDFLHFVPGIEVNVALAGNTLVQIRGLPNKSNQKVLFLLDDVPYWMPASGDFPILGLPLEGIEKIEIIRGPGSVVYGTNASAGIIKVVTRKDTHSTFNGYVNNDSLFNTSIFSGYQIDHDKYINFAAEIQRDDGYSYEVRNAATPDACLCFDVETDNGSLTRKEELESILTNWRWGQLSGTVQLFNSETTGDATGSISTPTMYEIRGELVGVNYKHAIDSGELDFYLDYNRYYRQIYIENLLVFSGIPGDGSIEFENDGGDNDRVRAGISIKSDVSKNLTLLSGLEYEDRSTENLEYRDDVGGANINLLPQPPFIVQADGSILVIGADNGYEKSAYLQADYQQDNWRLVTGARYVDNSLSRSNISPRASLVYSVSDKESIKLLYSQGFNSPTFGQNSGANIFGALQTADIEAETIRTWEFAYTHTRQRMHHVASLFYIEAHDLILRDINGTMNSDDIVRRSGVEYDFQYRKNGLVLLSGVSYTNQGNKNKANDPDALFTSRWLAKFGANYKYQQHLFGGSLRAASARASVSEYYWLNLHYRNAINTQLTVYSTIANILDDEIISPDVKNAKKVTLQSANERALFVGMQYKFD